MSELVSLFYTPLEKLGLKKHKHTQDELDYLDKFNRHEQCEIFKEEYDFNINRIIKKNKFAKSVFVFSFLFLISLLLNTQYLNWISFSILSVSIVASFMVILRYKMKIDIIKIQKNFFTMEKERLIEKTFG